MKAIKEVDDGILIDIEVSTKSSKFEISRYNEWRERIEIRIKSPPHKGKANKEIIREFLRLTKRDIEIITGLKSQQKTLKVYGISKKELLKILNV